MLAGQLFSESWHCVLVVSWPSQPSLQPWPATATSADLVPWHKIWQDQNNKVSITGTSIMHNEGHSDMKFRGEDLLGTQTVNDTHLETIS